jgi:hypothetical protein
MRMQSTFVLAAAMALGLALSSGISSPTWAYCKGGCNPPPNGPGATRLPVRFRPLPHPFCAPGTSWQYGCVQWAPAPPGLLFGACVRNAWSCKRVAGPIQ